MKKDDLLKGLACLYTQMSDSDKKLFDEIFVGIRENKNYVYYERLAFVLKNK